MLKDNIKKIKGRLKITTYKAGTKEIIKETDWINNLVVSNDTGNGHGLNLLIKRLINNTTTDLVITQGKIGDSDTTPTDADTDLGNTILSGILVASAEETTEKTALLQFFMTDTELANGDYKEFGMFCGDQLFCRAIITPTYTKTAGQDTTISYEITTINA